MKNAGRILSGILALAQLSWATPCFAVERLVAPPRPRGEAYFKLERCEQAMAAFSNGEVESYLMNMATTPGQRFQLLSDYGLFFTKEYYGAMLLAMQDIKVAPQLHNMASLDKFTRKELLAYVKALNALLRAPDAEIDKLIFKIFEHLGAVVTLNRSDVKAEVVALQMKRLKAAIEDSQNKSDYYDIIRVSTRLVLLKTLKKAFEEFKKQNVSLVTSEDFAIGMTVGAIATVVIPGIYLSYFVVFENERLSRHSDTAWLMFGGLALLELTFGLQRLYRWLAPKWQIKPPRLTGYSAQLVSEQAQQIETKFNDLFEEYSKQMDGNIVTLEQACKTTDLCTLNPVQLAYIGHTDILELEAMADKLQLEQAIFTPEKLKAIQMAADKVIEEPGRYRAHAGLIETVGAYVLAFEETKKGLTDSLAVLAKKIGEVRTQTQVLRSKPYQFDVRKVSQSLLDKSETLIAKLDSDLASLRKMELDQDKFLKDIRLLDPHIEKLKSFLEKANSPEAPWKELTEQLLFNLDEIPTGAQ